MAPVTMAEELDNSLLEYPDFNLDGLDDGLPETITSETLNRFNWQRSNQNVEEEFMPFFFDHVLSELILQGGSDLHMHADQTIVFRVNGQLRRQTQWSSPTSREMEDYLDVIVKKTSRDLLGKYSDTASAYILQQGPYKGYRFRVHVGYESIPEQAPYFVLRVITPNIPDYHELGISEEMMNWTKRSQGLVLINGPTGTGKSTTLAAMLKHSLDTQSIHLLTIESPIEFKQSNGPNSIVTQREVYSDTQSFDTGMRWALRDDPDAILIGESRYADEMRATLWAANSGHLTYTTLHTNSIATTISRILKMYTYDERESIVEDLASVLVGIACQVLVLTPDKQRRVALREVLTVDDDIRNMVLRSNVNELNEYMYANGRSMSLQIRQAIFDGLVDPADAIRQGFNRYGFDGLLPELNEFIRSTPQPGL